MAYLIIVKHKEDKYSLTGIRQDIYTNKFRELFGIGGVSKNKTDAAKLFRNLSKFDSIEQLKFFLNLFDEGENYNELQEDKTTGTINALLKRKDGTPCVAALDGYAPSRKKFYTHDDLNSAIHNSAFYDGNAHRLDAFLFNIETGMLYDYDYNDDTNSVEPTEFINTQL